MSRRRAAVKRDVLPDPKFGDAVVTKFMNCLMHEGKKSVAEHIVYGAFDRIQKRSGQDPIRVFHEALTNVRPAVEVRSHLECGDANGVAGALQNAVITSCGSTLAVLC